MTESNKKKYKPARVVFSEAFGRLIRQDDWDELGQPTSVKLREAMEVDDTETALALVDYGSVEFNMLHSSLIDWIAYFIDWIGKRYGKGTRIQDKRSLTCRYPRSEPVGIYS